MLPPYSITKVDWSSGAAGAEQTIYFDEDGGNIVHDDAQRAAETGPIPYRRSTQTFIHGTGGDALEIGFHSATLPPQCNDEVAAPVYEVFAPMRPAPNRWTAYPAMATYDAATDSTFLKPCKFVIKDQPGNVLGVIEMHDHLPLSSPLLGQVRNATTALRPIIHTKMMLYWVSHRLKLSANARRWNNGMVPGTSNRRGQARQMASSNPSIPLLGTFGNQINGYLQWHWLPAWPMTTSATNADDPVTDPVAPQQLQYNPTGNNTDGGLNGFRASGYMYEPGAIAGHNWRTPPGGNEFSRFFIPSQFAAFLTEPDGLRPQGSVPYKLLAHEYGKGYFNRSHHEVTNVRTLETLPHEQVAYGQWAYCYGYYTPQGPIFVAGGQTRHIDQKAITNTPTPVDKDGRLPYHGAELDALHPYANPAWYALLFNSVAALVSAKLFYNAAMMSNGSSGSPTASPIGDGGFLMQRQHAWRYLNQGLQWKIGTQHPIGLGRDKTQARFVAELEYFHDVVVVPATDPANANYSNLYFTCLRNFGIPGKEVITGSTHHVAPVDDAKLLYMAGVLATMKSTGSFDALRAVSVKCQKSIDLVLASVRKYSIGRMNATHGRNMGLEGGRLGPDVPLSTPLVPLAGWTEWAAALAPVDGQADMVTNADGTPYFKERQQYQHLLVQAIFIMRDFIGDTSPDVVNACAITKEMEDRFAAAVANNQTEDFTYRHPAAGILAAPAAMTAPDVVTPMPPLAFIGGALGAVPLGVSFLPQTSTSGGSSVTSVTLSPAAVTMAAGEMQQFDAIVGGTGSPSQEVTWTEPSAGVLSSAGFFTAPQATDTQQTIDIIATSVQNPGVFGMATVTILAAGAPENPGFSRSKTRTITIKAAPLTFEGSKFWDLTDAKHPVGTIDPDATIDISFNWSEVLADIGETEIGTVQFDIDGLTNAGAYFVGGYATIFVKEPTGAPRITCRITTKSTPARVEDRTVFLKIEAE